MSEQQDLDLRMSQLTAIVAEFCKGRRSFITRKGYIGLGLHSAQKGDLIFVLQGADMPIVLRTCLSKHRNRAIRGDSFPRYEVVCAAYIQGIKQGEAMDEAKGRWKHIFLA